MVGGRRGWREDGWGVEGRMVGGWRVKLRGRTDTRISEREWERGRGERGEKRDRGEGVGRGERKGEGGGESRFICLIYH